MPAALQVRLDPVPELLTDDRLMLAREVLALVRGNADVNRIVESAVDIPLVDHLALALDALGGGVELAGPRGGVDGVKP